MSAELYFIRHAESELNVAGGVIIGRSNHIDLSPDGHEQAEILGNYLRAEQIKPDYVYSSIAKRARKTAEISLASMGIERPVITSEAIQERDQGAWEGKPIDVVLQPKALEFLMEQGKNFRPPGGESENDVGRRMYAWMDSTVSRTPDTVTLAYTHRNAILGLVALMEDWSAQKTYGTHCPNTSITKLVYEDSWRIVDIARDPAAELEKFHESALIYTQDEKQAV